MEDPFTEICDLINEYRDEQIALCNNSKADVATEILRRISAHQSKKYNDLLSFLQSNSGSEY